MLKDEGGNERDEGGLKPQSLQRSLKEDGQTEGPESGGSRELISPLLSTSFFRWGNRS